MLNEAQLTILQHSNSGYTVRCSVTRCDFPPFRVLFLCIFVYIQSTLQIKLLVSFSAFSSTLSRLVLFKMRFWNRTSSNNADDHQQHTTSRRASSDSLSSYASSFREPRYSFAASDSESELDDDDTSVQEENNSSSDHKSSSASGNKPVRRRRVMSWWSKQKYSVLKKFCIGCYRSNCCKLFSSHTHSGTSSTQYLWYSSNHWMLAVVLQWSSALGCYSKYWNSAFYSCSTFDNIAYGAFTQWDWIVSRHIAWIRHEPY